MAPKRAAPTRKVVEAAALNVRLRNMRTSISGRSARSEWRTKSATSATPATIGPHTRGSVKPPCDSLSDSPNTNRPRPGESSSSPRQSSFPASARPASLFRSFAASASANSAIGTLT